MRRTGFASGGYIFDTFGQQLAAKEDSFDKPLETLLSGSITGLSQEDAAKYLSGVYKIINEGLLLAKFVQHGLLQRLQEVIESKECHVVNKYFILIIRALLMSRDKSIILEIQHNRSLQVHLLRLYLLRDFATSSALIDILDILMNTPCIHTARCFMIEEFVLFTSQRILSLPTMSDVGERLLSLLLLALKGACDGEKVKSVVPKELLVSVIKCARNSDVMHIATKTLALDFLATYCEKNILYGESDIERSTTVVGLGGIELVEEGIEEMLGGMTKMMIGTQNDRGVMYTYKDDEKEDLSDDIPALECPFKTLDLGSLSTQLVRLACALSFSSPSVLLHMVHIEELNRAVISTAALESFGNSLALLFRPQDWDRVREETRKEVSNGYYIHLPLLLSGDVKALCRQVRIACISQHQEGNKEEKDGERYYNLKKKAVLAFTKIINNASSHRETKDEILICRNELISVSSELLYLYRNDEEVVGSVITMLLELGVKSEEDSDLNDIVNIISSASSSLKTLLNVEKPDKRKKLTTANWLILIALFIECLLVIILVLKVSQKQHKKK